MRRSEEALDEYDVHDKEYYHAYSNKYLRTDQPLSLLRVMFGENKSLEGSFSFLGELLTCAAMATDTFLGCEAHTRRMIHASIRAMQKPEVRADMINFRPRRRLSWKMVMWVAAPRMKSTKNTAVMGVSSLVVGWSPRPAFFGG
jgi:hypothetical protein